MFDSCWPGVQQNLCVLYTPYLSTKHRQFRGRLGRRSGGDVTIPNRTFSFKINTPSTVPLPRRTFVKVCFPATHSPTRTLQSSAIRDGFGDRLVPRRKTDFIDIYILKSGPGSREAAGGGAGETGLSFLPGKVAR